MIELPEGMTNPRIVKNYVGNPVILVNTSKELRENWKSEYEDILQAKKIEIIEQALGYKLENLADIISKEDYMKTWEQCEKAKAII